MRRFVGSVLFVTAVVVGVGAGMAPAQATGGADTFPATQIAAGGNYTCALISDGTVTCWGYGGYGQLGTGDTNNSNVPVAVTGGALANKTVTQIAAGNGHTCALISDGTVTCWGYGADGELGTGNNLDSNIPVAVTGGALENKTVTQIETGSYHTCALISDGTVTCWGAGASGQLGTGDTNDSNIPVAVTGGALENKTVTQIAAGYAHTCAVVSDGTVTCWGNGADGRLGTGDTNSSLIPVAVTGGALENKTVTQIAASLYHTCALISDGTVTCWGYGQLGTGGTGESLIPVAVTGGALANKTVTEIETGGNYTCALISDGKVTCWGWGNYGQLGTGNNNDSLIPVAVTGGALANKTVTQIATGNDHTCAVVSDGTVTCWGYGADGQLGTGDNNSSNIPVAVTGGALENKTVTQIAAGSGHTCALISDGTVTCWGAGGDGRLGTGNNSSNVPVAVTGGALENKTVTQIAAGYAHTCAVVSDGTVTCWGYGADGELGTGNNLSSNIPVAVTGGALENKTVTHITVGTYHTCAVVSDGTVTCWGYGGTGRLGTGNDTDQNVPVAVTGGALENKTVTQIAAGSGHTCALISDGTVTCWGYGNSGRLGTGNTNNSNVPVAIVWLVQAANTVRPSISGAATVSQTLTADPGTWTGTPTPAITYQWYACTAEVTTATQSVPGTCSEISATENTLELTSAHAGKYMAVEVTGTSEGTDPVSWLAVSTATTVKMQAANTVRPTITGQARVGKTLTANKGTWTGFPVPSFTYKWYACNAKVDKATQNVPSGCKFITGATKATFKLTNTQKNKFIAVQVTGTSQGATATSWLSKTSAKVS